MANTEDRVQRPRSVALGVKILLAAAGIYLVRQGLLSLAGGMFPNELGAILFFIKVLFSVPAILLLLPVSAGRNWARITLAVLLALHILSAFSSLISESRVLLVLLTSGTLSAYPFLFWLDYFMLTAQIALEVYGLFLLFNEESREWFSAVSEQECA